MWTVGIFLIGILSHAYQGLPHLCLFLLFLFQSTIPNFIFLLQLTHQRTLTRILIFINFFKLSEQLVHLKVFSASISRLNMGFIKAFLSNDFFIFVLQSTIELSNLAHVGLKSLPDDGFRILFIIVYFNFIELLRMLFPYVFEGLLPSSYFSIRYIHAHSLQFCLFIITATIGKPWCDFGFRFASH